MAQVSVSQWNPFNVALDLTAGNITITRKSATQFTVRLSVSWKTSWSGAETDYGMDVTSGGVTKTISTQGTKRASGSGSLTGTYSINTNGASTVPISITFKNYNTWAGRSATKSLTLNVSVPAWPSWKVSYNLNGGSGSLPQQTKWKGQSLTLHKDSPTKTGYTFQGWTVTSSSSTVTYKAGAVYTGDAPMTLTAVWKANTYKITYYANGGTGAPGVQTKTYGVSLKLSSTIPTREKYKFKGWGKTASTTTASYQPGVTYTSNADVNLYAVWELAYTKPIIEELVIHRVVPNHDTGDFDLSDHGKSALVEFDWSSFQDVTAITIECNSKIYEIAASGKSGVVEKYIGDEELSDDSTYTIKVSVSDGNGAEYTSSRTRTLPGTKFVIDFLAGGNGAAIGKSAELNDVFDVGFQTKLSGGLLYPIIEPCDLNEVRTPNIYSGRNVKDHSYSCGNDSLPFSNGTFTLEVISSGPNGQVLQRITVCDKSNSQVYERWYYTSSWSEWTGGWITATLTSEFTMYGTDSDTNHPKYRKDGRVVEIRGIVTPTQNIVDSANHTEMHTIFTLPTGYRPNSPIYTICQGSGTGTWLLRITSNGTVDFSRYRYGDTYDTAFAPTGSSDGTWLPFQCTFLVG